MSTVDYLAIYGSTPRDVAHLVGDALGLSPYRQPVDYEYWSLSCRDFLVDMSGIRPPRLPDDADVLLVVRHAISLDHQHALSERVFDVVARSIPWRMELDSDDPALPERVRDALSA